MGFKRSIERLIILHSLGVVTSII